MKITTLRRLGAASIAPALAAGVLIAAPAAQAAPAPANPSAYSAARWLADQIDVTVGADYFEGTALDIFFALDDLAARPTDAQRILTELGSTEHTDNYVGVGSSTVAGATGKLTTAVQAAGGDTSDFGDSNVDLIGRLESTIVTTGDEAGRGKDQGGYLGADYSSTFGQVWVVQALANDESSLAASATDYLLKQQCPSGAFRGSMFHVNNPADQYDGPSVDLVCGAGPISGDDDISVDATGLALRALLVAKANGITGLDDDIADGVTWLNGQQNADGSFSANGAANTNATGLAAAALVSAGQPGPAAAAASWLYAHQVTDTLAEGTALTNELGAIALDDIGLAEGKANGIPAPLSFGSVRGEWISATAQSAAGLNALLPAAKLTVAAPGGFLQGAKPVVVTSTGLGAGEKYTVTVAGGGTARGVADASGAGSVSVIAGVTTGPQAITVTGSRTTRTGATTVSVLGARKVTPSIRSSVKRGKTQRVTIKGLAPGETVTVYESNKRKKTATADAAGTYSFTYKVSRSKSAKGKKKTIKVVGAFSDRTGTKAFRIK